MSDTVGLLPGICPQAAIKSPNARIAERVTADIENPTPRRVKNRLDPTEETPTNPAQTEISEAVGAGFSPGLYLVATPIGNAEDITLRALNLLKRATLIACEDTRVTGPLRRRYGIPTPLVAYHDHNGAAMRPKLLARVRAGEVVALVSDAGMPLISDPGYKLVREAQAEGLPVTSLPGASAVLTAVQLSGLPSDRFLFAGFPDHKSGARQSLFRELAKVPATLIFFEGPSRVADSLADMATVFGAREAALVREITKLYEEVRRAALPDLARHYKEAGPPRGEIVIVVAPPGEEAATAEADLDTMLREALATHSVRDAADLIATATGQPRRAVYARALQVSKDG